MLKHLKKKKFVIITGGGKTARNYQKASRDLGALDDEDADWIGIHATRINAHLLKIIFKEHTNKRTIFDPTKKIVFEKRICIAAGWKPGFSTDYDAVLIAKNLKSNTVINLSNIDYVYDKNPNEYKNAKKIKEISWKAFRKIVGDKWSPGFNAPFDPIASKLAEKLKLTVIIADGNNMKNVDNYLNKKSFIGTIIR